MAADLDVLLPPGQRHAGGNLDLLLDQIDARHLFRDGVLDLNPRVHLHEVEAPLLVQKKLDRARVAVVDGLGRLDRHPAQLPPETVVHCRRGCFLDELLVAALHGAVALPQENRPALLVRQDLDFDVPRFDEKSLDVHALVPERQRRLRPGRLKRMGQLALFVHHAHTAPAATCGRLDDHRIADLGGHRRGFLLVGDLPLAARQHR